MAALHALDHPTADQVFHHVRAHHPRISLGTVYRNLEQAQQSGRVTVREYDGVRRYDVHTEPHVHLHDNETGRLVDVPIPEDLQRAIDRLADEHGIAVGGVRVELEGRLQS